MSLKRRLAVSNFIMLLVPVIIISIAAAMLFVLFFTDLFVPLFSSRLQTPAELIEGSAQVTRNPQAVKILGFWALFSIAVICVTNSVITYRLSKSILAPISELKLAARRIESGDLDFDILSSRYTEIEELCRAVDMMRMHLRQSRLREERLESEKNIMLAHLSHDLKTPITSIKGYAQGIIDNVASTPEKRTAYAKTILAKACTLEELAGNISEYSSLDLSASSMKMKNGDFSDFIAEICTDYRQEFEEYGITLTLDGLGRPFIITADFEKLFRVFSNLFENSIKYRRSDSRQVTVSVFEKDGGVYTAVADDGIGVPPELSERVFDNFFRADAARTSAKGSGLGLAIARKITESHGGKIWLKPNESGGTTAMVYLPAAGKQQ